MEAGRTKNKIRILYINHESGIAGAGLSLAYLIREINREEYEPVIACDLRHSLAREFFRSEGFVPYDLKVRRFSHTSLSSWPVYSPYGLMALTRWFTCQFPAGRKALKELLRKISPDIVHLNSVTLLPYAPTIRKEGISVVLHVREPVIRGLFGIRRAWLRWLGRNAVDAIIYICEDNRLRLTGNHPKGKVIYNFVAFDKFDRNIDQQKARQQFGIPCNRKVLLFPGGSKSSVKGIFPLLDALVNLRKQFPDLVCLMPGAASRSPVKLGWLKSVLLRLLFAEPKIKPRIKKLKLENILMRTAFSYEVEKFYAACDIVVIPFVVPHFARPVIEAGAMVKAVVASRVGGVEEVVKDGVTGLMVEPGNAEDLAEKITILLNDSTLAEKLGEGGYKQARRLFDAKLNAVATMKVYEEVLKNKRKHNV